MDTRLQMLEKIGQSTGGRNPSQEGEYQELLRQSQPQISNAASFAQAPVIDPVAQAQKLREFNIQSNQPQISSLQAQIPEVEQKFGAEQTRLAGEKAPLTQRYNNIIDQLTQRETKDISAVQRRTGQEFGYRGIPASSTLYLDELSRAESPIRQAYGGQIKDVGFEREGALRNIDQLMASLAGQSTEAKRTVQNAIGALQSGDPASAIQGAMQILQLQQQAGQNQTQNLLAQQQQGLREREFGLQEQIANRPKEQDQFATLSKGSTLFNLLTGQPIYTAPTGAGGLNTGMSLDDLYKMAGGE